MTKTFVGQTGAKFATPSNWSDKNTSFNQDCLINNLSGGSFIVYHDVADGDVGPIGRLFLNNVSLILTNVNGGQQGLAIGDVVLRGTSTITVNAGWIVGSGNVVCQDSSILTVNPLAVWAANNANVLAKDTAMLVISGSLQANNVFCGLASTVHAYAANFIGNLIVAGSLWLHWLGSLQITNVTGNLETGEALNVDVSSTSGAQVQVVGSVNVTKPAKAVNIGTGPAGAGYSYVVALGPNLSYTALDQVILGTTFKTVANVNGPWSALTWVPGSTAAPSAPTGVAASASGGVATISWSTVTGATWYNLYYGTSSGGESSTPYISGITTLSVTDTIYSGQTRYYKVTAANPGGESAQSSEVNATG